MTNTLLQVEQINIKLRDNSIVSKASFSVKKGQITCIVGQSGSGKSMLIHSILGILPHEASASGKVIFLGEDLLQASEDDLQALRGQTIFSLFQDAMNSFNPNVKISRQLFHLTGRKKGHSFLFFQKKMVQIMSELKLSEPNRIMSKYPFQLSGGMLQRCIAACALYMEPKLLIADEPTSSLDMIVQKELIELLMKMNRDKGTAILLVTHDLGIVAEAADEVIVMFNGKIVETGTVSDIFEHPSHPYTKKLLQNRLTSGE